jgi:hypothetical protein
MELQEQLTSVAGMLRPFKKFILEAGMSDGDQIVFYGCPGTCTPFVELLGFAIRDLPFEQIFVPHLDEGKAKVMAQVADIGMQATETTPVLKPGVVVLMGGLAMPNVPVSAEMANQTIAGYGARTIGICFMNMFEKAGWLNEIDFELVIDATIDPVNIWK